MGQKLVKNWSKLWKFGKMVRFWFGWPNLLVRPNHRTYRTTKFGRTRRRTGKFGRSLELWAIVKILWKNWGTGMLWESCGNPVGILWDSCGIPQELYKIPTWITQHSHRNSSGFPHDCTGIPQDSNMIPTGIPQDSHLFPQDSIWFQKEFYKIPTWIPQHSHMIPQEFHKIPTGIP